MAALLRQHGIRGSQRQASEFYKRERQRAHRSPGFGLFPTHRFVAADSPIASTVWPHVALPVLVRGLTISFTATDTIDDSADQLAAFAVGDVLRISDLDGGANDGLIVSVSVVAAGQITVNEATINTQAAGDAIVLTRVELPELVPVAFEVLIQRDTVAQAGVVCEFGSVTRGGGIWVDGTQVGACAGGNAAASDGADILVANVFNADASQVLITAVIHPGTGVINLLANGRLVGAAVSVDGDFGVGWRDANDGGVEALEGTISDRFGQTGALTNATLIGEVKAFHNQRPRAFHATGLGTDGGLGSWTN